MSRILVTGGAGFIGCNLTDALLKQGHGVIVFDSLERGGAERNLEWLRARHGSAVQLVRGDVRDYDALSVAAKGAEIIYHLASQVAVTTSVLDPRTDFEVNALGTFNALEVARGLDTDPIFVFTSTNKVYGAMEDVAVTERETRYEYRDFPQGIDETRLLDFHSPYGCSKGAGDQYVRDYARIYGLRAVVFRMSCIYGTRQFGVEDQGWVAHFLISAILGRPIYIYGNGKQVRDVLYVDDLVRAFQLAVKHIDVTAGQVYNIGGGPGNTTSIWVEFKERLAQILGQPVEAAEYRDWRPGDQPICVTNTAKALRDMGWSPRVGMEEGLQMLSRWVRDNKELIRREVL
jgi:CDP-paratose 2-epimerase